MGKDEVLCKLNVGFVVELRPLNVNGKPTVSLKQPVIKHKGYGIN